MAFNFDQIKNRAKSLDAQNTSVDRSLAPSAPQIPKVVAPTTPSISKMSPWNVPMVTPGSKKAKEEQRKAIVKNSWLENYNLSLPGIGRAYAQANPQIAQNAVDETNMFINEKLDNPMERFAFGAFDKINPAGSALNNLERTVGDLDTEKLDKSIAYQAGNMAGYMGQYALSGGLGIESAVFNGMKALPRVAGMGKIASPLLRGVTSNAVGGLPINVTTSLDESVQDGKVDGGQFAKSMAINTAIDTVLGGAVEGISALARLRRYSKAKQDEVISKVAKETGIPEDEVKLLTGPSLTSEQKLAYDSNVRKGKITPENGTLYGNSFEQQSPLYGSATGVSKNINEADVRQLPAPADAPVKTSNATTKPLAKKVDSDFYTNPGGQTAKDPKTADIKKLPQPKTEIQGRNGVIGYVDKQGVDKVKAKSEAYRAIKEAVGAKDTQSNQVLMDVMKAIDTNVKDGWDTKEFWDAIIETVKKQEYEKVDPEKLYPGLKKEIRETPIRITGDLKQITDFNDLRKKSMGKVKLTKNGKPMDELYMELSEMHPDLFPSSITHPTEQLETLIKVSDSLNPTVKTMGDVMSDDDLWDGPLTKVWKAINDYRRTVKEDISYGKAKGQREVPTTAVRGELSGNVNPRKLPTEAKPKKELPKRLPKKEADIYAIAKGQKEVPKTVVPSEMAGNTPKSAVQPPKTESRPVAPPKKETPKTEPKMEVKNAESKRDTVPTEARKLDPKAERVLEKLNSRLRERGEDGERFYEAVKHPRQKEIDVLADLFKAKVVTVKPLKETADTFHGVFVDDTIVINLSKTSNPAHVIFGHEVLHQVRANHSAEYDRFAKVFAKSLDESKVKMYKESLEQAEGKMTDDAMLEEMIADFSGEMFNDPKIMRRIFEEDRTVAQWIHDIITGMITKIKDSYVLSTSLKDLKAVQDEYVKLMKGAKDAPNIGNKVADEIIDGLQKNAERIKTDYKSFENPAVKFSTKRDTVMMDDAIELNRKTKAVAPELMADTKEFRKALADEFAEMQKLGMVPEDTFNSVKKDAIHGNSSYVSSAENSLMCYRTIMNDLIISDVSTRLGRPLTVPESVAVSQEMFNWTSTPECLYCYNSADRKAFDEFLLTYMGQKNKFKKAYKESGNFKRAYEEFLGKRKPTKEMEARANMWAKEVDKNLPSISLKDLATPTSRAKAWENPKLREQIADAQKYAQSASWAKKKIEFVSYNGGILNIPDAKVKEWANHYGMRMYSFSDFSPAYILENIQMVVDASVRKLPILAYTKEKAFAEIFGPTGLSLNVSVYGYKGADGKIHPDGMQGMDWDEVKRLREKYPAIGSVFVATDDDMVKWALDEDWIDMVIPFHSVRSKKVADILGYTDNRAIQSDKKLLPKEAYKKGEDSIYPYQHNNDKETFLKLADGKFDPRFKKWVDHPNYMKLVNETRLSVNEIKPVQPTFDKDAVRRTLDQFKSQGGYYAHGGISNPKTRERIVSRIEPKIRDMKTELPEGADVKFSIKRIEENRAKALKQFGTTTNFNEAGYLMPDGKMLDFSGKKESGVPNVRWMDHRDIQDIYDEIGHTDAMNQFISEGNIRMMPESPGLDMSVNIKPTDDQMSVIKRYIDRTVKNDYFSVDFSANDGKIVDSLIYDGKVNANKVISDIQYFYTNGKVPRRSELDQFRFSLKRDSDGKHLTKEQEAFFKDSKVRDEDGNLLKVYHGTSDEFTVFDPNSSYRNKMDMLPSWAKKPDDGTDKIGLNWATGDVDYAKHFSDENVMSGYLNIKKMLDIDVIDGYYDFDKQISILSEKTGIPVKELELMADGSYLTIYDITRSKKFADKVSKLGYDGVIAWENGTKTYGFIDSNQFKSVDNLNPTTDPDIRFSSKRGTDADNIKGKTAKGVSMKDSVGKALTEEQVEFFKGSKVRDSEGKLLQLYHGSFGVGKFFEFNTDTIFLTTDSFVASKYSSAERIGKENVHYYSVYADLENPLVVDASKRIEGKYDVTIKSNPYTGKNTIELSQNGETVKTITTYNPDDFARWFGENKATQFLNGISKAKQTKDAWGNKYHKYSAKGVQTQYSYPSSHDAIEWNGSKYTADELAKVAKAKGYDGVIINNVIDDLSFSETGTSATNVIAFESNQVKLTSNLNPTTDPDIRFSMKRGMDDGNARLEAERKMQSADKKVKEIYDENVKEIADAEVGETGAWFHAKSITDKGVGRHLDITRLADYAFKKSEEGRKWFRENFENDFYKSKGKFTDSTIEQTDTLYNEVVKKYGIWKGSKESAGMQQLGEGMKLVKDGKEWKAVEYTLDDLKKDFDYTMKNGKKAWENIVEAEKVTRKMYDDYIDRINGALKEIYPNVEANVEDIYRRAMKAKLETGNVVHSISRGNQGVVQKVDGDSVTVHFKNQETGKEATVVMDRKDLMNQKHKQELEDATVGKRLFARQNYYRHFSEMQGSFLVGLDNIINGATNIDPRLIDVSRGTQPNSKWSGFLQHRGKGTDYMEDAVGGMLEYIPQAEYKINIEPNIPKLRKIIKELQESTIDSKNANGFIDNLMQIANDLAGKTNPIDRVWGDVLGDARGRMVLNGLSRVSNRVRANAVMGNVNTMIAQFFNFPNVVAYTMQNAKGTGGKGIAEGIEDAIKAYGGNREAQEILNKSMFLKERYIDRKYRRFDRGISASTDKLFSWTMELGDKIVADGAFLTFYRQNIAKGMDEMEAVLKADELTRKSVGGRGIAEMPLSQKAKTTKLFAPFQVEVRNAISVLKELGISKDPYALAGIFVGMFGTSMLMNLILEKTTGREIGLNPYGMIMNAVKDEDSKSIPYRLVGNFVTNYPGGSYIADVLKNTLDMDDYNMQKMFGDQEPSRFGTGNMALQTLGKPVGTALKQLNNPDNTETNIDLLQTASMVLPKYGGKQIERTVRGLQDMALLPKENINLNSGVSLKKRELPASYTATGKMRFPIEKTPLNYALAPTLGVYATKQGKDYITKDRRYLGEKDTAKIEQSKEPIKAYDKLIYDRDIKRIKTEIKDIKKNDEYSDAKKNKKIVEQLREQIKVIKGSGHLSEQQKRQEVLRLQGEILKYK